MSQPLTPNRSILPIIIAAVVLIVIIGAAVLFTAQSNKSDSKNSSSSSSSLAVTNSLAPIAALSLSNLQGQYSGSASILTGFLRFPKSEITLKEDGNTILKASGLDLTIINDPKLQVDGAYPIADVQVTGLSKVSSAVDSKLAIEVKTIDISLLAKGIKIDATRQAEILAVLATKGIVVPTLSSTPTVAEVKVQLDSKSGIIITSQIDSPILINFSGKKV